MDERPTQTGDTTTGGSSDSAYLARVLEAAIRIGLLIVFVGWCFLIVRPFVVPVIWAVVIAIAVYPAYGWLRATLRGRDGIAAALFTLFAFAVLITPALLLGGTLLEGARAAAAHLREGTLTIPPPPEGVSGWPIIGEPLAELWTLVSTNLAEAMRQIAPQLRPVATWLVTATANGGLALVQFAISIVIAAVLLAHAARGRAVAEIFAARLAGAQGIHLVELAGATVQSVALGILGVAIIQSLLAGLGFLVVGVPAAGLLAGACLLLCVVQIGILPIVVPVAIYVFFTANAAVATLFLIWSVAVTLVDNILKPLLLGRGVAVPTIIIFVGSIGGFLTSGFIGLFVGAVVLAVGYELVQDWLGEHRAPVPGEAS